MKHRKTTKTIFGAIIIAFTLILPTLVHAQDSSTGRTAGSNLDMGDKSYKAMQRIRKYINKGEFDKAESRSKRIIRAEDRSKRTGLSKSDVYKDAYNTFCVSLTGQGKIDEAMEACNQSIEYSPKQWESLKSRATLYFMKQDFRKSLSDFTLALDYAPNNKAVSDVLKQNIGVVKSKIN
ncbi:MAG: hypothetical protein JKY84_02160 [Emcibacteraceae bacterium]|nr:hypothetical protein [Emcibacteraceae bacterium]